MTTLPKVLVTGAAGQVGCALVRTARQQGGPIRLVAFDRAALDITDAASVATAFAHVRPDAVINAAAYTAVDRAESDRDASYAVNRDGPARLAAACAAHGVPLLHISTDYIFDGTKPGAYVEDDAAAPLNVYGLSKAAGEAAVRAALDRHIILRTSWVYGVDGTNFVKTMLRLGRERDRLRIVADQQGSPTTADSIAHALLIMARRLVDDPGAPCGTFHFTGQGVTTWHGFACAIFDRLAASGARVPAEIEAIPSRDYPTPARRPANSVLDCSRIEATFGIVAPPWSTSLAIVLDQLTALAAT